VCELSREDARALLHRAGGTVKTAIVMHFLNASRDDAEQALARAGGGIIRKAIGREPPPVVGGDASARHQS